MLQKPCGAKSTIPIMSRDCGRRFVLSVPTVNLQTRKNRNKKTEIGCQVLLKTNPALFWKAALYRYTGWYTAQKEEDQFMQSLGAQRDVERIFTKALDWGIESREEAVGIVIGSWQAEHGFCRPAVFVLNMGIGLNPVLKTVHWSLVLYTALKWDLARAWWKLSR